MFHPESSSAASPDPGPSSPVPGPGLALRLFVVALAAFLLLRSLLAGWGVAGVAVAEWVGLVLFPVGLLRLRGLAVGPSAALRPISGRQVAGSAALGMAGLPLAWGVHWLQSRWIETDPEVLEILNQALLPEDAWRFLLLLGLAVVTPAFCEEFLFRGILQEGLGRRVPGWVAVGVSALAFGLLHWSPGAAFRILPTVALGVLLGWASWRSGSLLAAVGVHLTHNFVILAGAALAVAAPGPAPVAEPPGDPPAFLLLAGVALVALGSHLLTAPSTEPTTP